MAPGGSNTGHRAYHTSASTPSSYTPQHQAQQQPPPTSTRSNNSNNNRDYAARRFQSCSSSVTDATDTSSVMTQSIHMAPSASRHRSGSTKHNSLLNSDKRLLEVVADTETTIDWDRILRQSDDHQYGGSSRSAQWKWLDTAGHFSLYSKQIANQFEVLAVGVVPCSVPELVRILHAPNGQKFLLSMEALYGDGFKDGGVVHQVNLAPAFDGEDDYGQLPPASPDLMDVTVKSLVFAKPGWLNHHEKWNFVDAAYRRQDGKVFEKITTTIHPKDTSPTKVGAFHHGGVRKSRARRFHDVTTAFSVQPEQHAMDDDEDHPNRKWRETRVLFYGEFAPPSPSRFAMPSSLSRSLPSSSTDKAIKHRLLAMAKSCERLTELVRRRRLGVQVLVDRKRLSFFLASARKCVCCNKSIVLLSAKQCRLCGQGVCSDCSHKHERETQTRGRSERLLLEEIRVCDRCMDRVDRSDFSELSDASLLGPVVVANPPNAPPAASVLKELLKDELLNAETNERKASVMNVIKHVLKQEDHMYVPPSPAGSTVSTSSSRRGGGGRGGGGTVLHTPAKSLVYDADYVEALESLQVPQVPFNEAPLASEDGRTYAVDSSNPSQQMVFPVPDNEAARLAAMEKNRMKDLINNSDELNIICELAAKEMDTFASMVTMVTPDEQQVVASNLDGLQNAKFARSEAFCSHTIMDDRPLLIPHPEADVRFHASGPVKDLGIRYYCGFPIKSDDNTVIGALCCINKTTKDMTETQYNAMEKLAQTAGRVIQVQSKQAAAKENRAAAA